MNVNKLYSGEDYTLRDLFGGEFKLVIPDLQRDYCWGLQTYDSKRKAQGELVGNFIENIIDAFSQHSDESLTLGVIYGYEAPEGQIQLCDGQQRITTLFILLGVLNRYLSGNNSLKEYIISNKEIESNDMRPTLLYAIRESTLYFLSDLVSNYFLDNKQTLNFNSGEKAPILQNEERPSWYYSEYDEDPSIQSILGAIRTIERNKKFLSIEDYSKFAEFVLNKIKILYYDMGSRINGEETFVVINTTGEPLTPTENLKPILIGNITNDSKKDKIDFRKVYSDQWEVRETWFWKNRDTEKELTSDNLSRDFYTWYWQINTCKENVDIRKNFISSFNNQETLLDCLRNVNIFFTVLKSLLNLLNKDELKGIINNYFKKNNIITELRKDKNRDILLPLLKYVEKYEIESPTSEFVRFVRRVIKNHISNDYEQTRRKFYIDWRNIVKLIENCHSQYELLTFNNSSSESDNILYWYNQDEVLKDRFSNCLDIVDWEQNEDLQYDLNIIWGNNQYESPNYYERRYKNLTRLQNIIVTKNKEDRDTKDYKLYNLYATYRVLKDWGGKISHVFRLSSEAYGRYINSDPYIIRYENNYEYCYSDKDFNDILDSDDLEIVLERKIYNYVSNKNILNIDAETSNVEKYIKAWVFSKMLICNSNGLIMSSSFFDGRAIGAYNDLNYNRLNNELPFSLYNSVTGYIKKNEVEFVKSENLHKIELLDTPLGDKAILESIDYQDFIKDKVPKAAVEAMKQYVERLYYKFLDTQN